jgi:hypothetical protein
MWYFRGGPNFNKQWTQGLSETLCQWCGLTAAG